MTNKKDDFLSQILAAEKTAHQKIEEAKKAISSDLGKYEKMLSEKLEKKINAARETAKKKLQEKQVAAKEVYKKMIEEARKEALVLEKDVKKKEDKVLAGAEAMFLSNII